MAGLLDKLLTGDAATLGGVLVTLLVAIVTGLWQLYKHFSDRTAMRKRRQILCDELTIWTGSTAKRTGRLSREARRAGPAQLPDRRAVSPAAQGDGPARRRLARLRHYAVSCWIEGGLAAKTVQTFAGHSNIAITYGR
jgi:integrase